MNTNAHSFSSSRGELQFDEAAPATNFSDSANAGPSEIDPRAILTAIRRNIVAIAIILAVFIGLGILATILMKPEYIGTSRILIEQQEDQIIEGSDARAAAASYMDADRFLQTQADIVTSRALAVQVVDREGLAESPAFFEAQGVEYPVEEDIDVYDTTLSIEELRAEIAADVVSENLVVTLPPDSRIVSVSFFSGDPVLAARIANAFAESFIEGNLARKFDSSSYAREFLAQQLQDARSKLEQSERDLNQFSRAAGLIRVAGQGVNADQETTLSITNNSLVQLNDVAAQATAQRVSAEQQWRNIANVPLLNIPEVLQNLAVQRLVEQRSAAEANLAQLSSRYLDDHPNVLAAKAQVDKLDAQIQALAQSIKNSIRLQYESARDRENSIVNQVDTLRADALDEQDRGVQYNVLKRVAETDRALYNTLLTRFNELNATAGATSNNVSLIDAAEPPREPASPRPLINLLAALLCGLVFAGGFVFFREQLDDAMRNPDDVEKKLGLPLLGLIPQVDQDEMKEELQDPKSPISEAYSALLTNIRYSSGNGIPETIVVTSSVASEGKTTTSFKLATDIADLGRRTLLIDADLRRPTMHRREEVGKHDGFTAVLAGELPLEKAILKSGNANLDLMTALPMPPDPVALLSSESFLKVVDTLRSQYDCVVFDAPPLLGLADATTLAAHVDAVVLAIDSQRGKGGGTRSAVRRLQMVGANIIGVVLTKFDARHSGSAYAYYGSSYYAYESAEEG
ncbi:polysaccharide biosynthesis tyrosine autokinase [Qipengyuania sp. GH38]|uniref:GumC family protein n=1 Tax=Qipengyuania intermedia TaxID=2867244 RepID=UPI001C8828CB|nr:polysaccharide biosynthesis tyrosine autokinase [Qipengyuania intermedia]